MNTNAYEVLKRPLITEKNTAHLAANVYAFEVCRDASKDQIASAIEKAFKVNVINVRTMNGRNRRRRMGRFVSRIRHFKKALVSVAAGQKIKIFEGA
jgi:large subunit ribosomal protein L23